MHRRVPPLDIFGDLRYFQKKFENLKNSFSRTSLTWNGTKSWILVTLAHLARKWQTGLWRPGQICPPFLNRVNKAQPKVILYITMLYIDYKKTSFGTSIVFVAKLSKARHLNCFFFVSTGSNLIGGLQLFCNCFPNFQCKLWLSAKKRKLKLFFISL